MDKFIHAFWHIKGNSYQKLAKLDRFFGDFQYAWEKASLKELNAAVLDLAYAQEIILKRKKIDLSQSMDLLWSNDIFLVDRNNQEFPLELKQIANPPFMLYRKGAPLNEMANRVAIVGMRKSSVQGEKLAFGLARNLVAHDVSVVSGLAFGIDAAAHGGTIQAEGKTIGVLASGIGKITPASHHNLAEKILNKGGAIISEYPVTADALKFQFIERNRIIAGLAHTVIVVEAAKKSGALITARHALEQGREILAFPGDPGRIQGQGCNNLIKAGEAQLVASIADVQENLVMRGMINNSGHNQKVFDANLSYLDKEILSMIENDRNSTNELEIKMAARCGDDGRNLLMESLSKLEIAGLIGKSAQMNWQRLSN